MKERVSLIFKQNVFNRLLPPFYTRVNQGPGEGKERFVELGYCLTFLLHYACYVNMKVYLPHRNQ